MKPKTRVVEVKDERNDDWIKAVHASQEQEQPAQEQPDVTDELGEFISLEDAIEQATKLKATKAVTILVALKAFLEADPYESSTDELEHLCR